jgi:uncharacterized surface protein with fasciclin (FAS1) repeats
MTTHTLPTIAAAAHATKSLATCARLLELAGLQEMLRGEGPYTLFAPTDVAFNAVNPEELAALESDPAQLRATLEYHILAADRQLGEMRDGKLATVEGTLLTSSVTDDGLRLDHANASGITLRCANGVIHQIDAVLFPGFTPPARGEKLSAWSGLRRASRVAIASPTSAAEALFGTP